MLDAADWSPGSRQERRANPPAPTSLMNALAALKMVTEQNRRLGPLALHCADHSTSGLPIELEDLPERRLFAASIGMLDGFADQLAENTRLREVLSQRIVRKQAP